MWYRVLCNVCFSAQNKTVDLLNRSTQRYSNAVLTCAVLPYVILFLKMNFTMQEKEIFTSLSAARSLLEQKQHRPLLLVDDSALEDFTGMRLCVCDREEALNLFSPSFQSHFSKHISILYIQQFMFKTSQLFRLSS